MFSYRAVMLTSLVMVAGVIPATAIASIMENLEQGGEGVPSTLEGIERRGIPPEIMRNVDAGADFYQEVAQWIVDEQPPVKDIMWTLDLSREEQFRIVREGALYMGMPADSVDLAIEELSEVTVDERREQDDGPVPQGSCYQNIESYPGAGISVCYGYDTSYGCDRDYGDRDYVFYFWPSWSDNSDDVRWNSFDPYLWLSLQAAYGGLLLGHDACTPDVRLCLGEWGVWLSGGATRVCWSLYISHV